MPYKLLLADDSVTIQRVIELTFADEDVTVTAVGDGEQAIAVVTADPPDIVLADVGMPKRNGYEVAEFIKNDPTLMHIPVLLLTGAFEPADDERAQAVRCDGLLAKPFEPQLLISRVRELLKGVTPSPVEPAAEERPEPDAAPPSDVEFTGSGQADASEDARPAPAAVADEASDAGAVDEDGTVRASGLPARPEDELRLDVASLEMQADMPPAPDASLDDYFDRLDAAFAHLAGGQSAREGGSVARTAATEPWSAGVKASSEWPQVRPGSLPTGAGADAHTDRNRTAVDLSGLGPGTGASSSPADDLEAASRGVSLPAPDAFAALIDAEREHGTDVVHRGAARSAAGVVLPGTAVTQAFIDEVARLVSERLGERAIRDEIVRIVSVSAERLIREEIERLKSGIRP